MHILYLIPRPNVVLTAPVGNVIRIQELIHGLEMGGDEVSTISAGEQDLTRESRHLYQSILEPILPVMLTRLTHDFFDITHDVMFQRKVKQLVTNLPLFDFIIEEYTFYSETGTSVSEAFGRPLILDDIVPIWEQGEYYGRHVRRIGANIQRKVFEKAAALIAVSNEMREYLLSCKVPENKIHIVANGADCNKFIPDIGGEIVREAYNIKESTVIGFVGSFAPWHGLDMLIASARDLVRQEEDIHFLLVGGSPKEGELEKKVNDLKISDRITFTGPVPYDQIPKFIDAMDIAVLPNTAPYCSPIKIFEYMAMEKAVVAPRYNPITEVITDGQDGLLFAPQDVTEMTQILFKLVRSISIRNELGKHARQKILKNFTWTKQAERLRNIIPS